MRDQTAHNALLWVVLNQTEHQRVRTTVIPSTLGAPLLRITARAAITATSLPS